MATARCCSRGAAHLSTPSRAPEFPPLRLSRFSRRPSPRGRPEPRSAAMEVAAAAASTDAGSARSPANKQNMFETFQAWANQNYGDSGRVLLPIIYVACVIDKGFWRKFLTQFLLHIGKTKTVTRRKYLRIVRILTGEEVASSENSKFRFWVRLCLVYINVQAYNTKSCSLYIRSIC